MFALQITSVTSGVPAGDPGRHMGHEFQKYEYEFDPSGTRAKTRPLGDEYEFDPSEARAKTRPLGDEYEFDPSGTRAKTRPLGDEFSTSTEEVMGHG